MQNSLEDYVDGKSKSWIDLRLCCTLQKCLFFLSLIMTLEASLLAHQYRICLQSRSFRRCRFDLWVGKIPWRRVWQPTPVFLPGESYGQRSLVGYSPWGHRVRNDWNNLAHTDIMALLMICFIFTEYWWHFRLVANMVLGQLKAHGHERLRACLDLPHSI